MPRQTAAVIGLGYVGQPLVGALANVGYHLIGMDIDRRKIEALSATYAPTILEPGLAETFLRCRDHIRFTTSVEDALSQADAVFITVGTPVGDDGVPDTSALDRATEEIGRHLRRGHIIVLRSTVPPGTTLRVGRELAALSGLRAGEDFFLSFCPERTIEGIALYELYNLPTIVGGINEESTRRSLEFLERLGTRTVTVSSPTVAEMCKLVDNMYRAVNIAFANELGTVCEAAGIDAYELQAAVNAAYPRTRIFSPGLGADGPCLSKDPLILRYFAAQMGVQVPLVNASSEVNQAATRRVVLEVQRFLAEQRLRVPRIALLGLSFKGRPETDDVRGSAAQIAYDALRRGGDGGTGDAEFSFFDPIVREFHGCAVHTHLADSLEGANVVVFLHDHPSIRSIPLRFVLEHTARPLLIVDAWHNVVGLNRKALPPDVTYVRIGDGA